MFALALLLLPVVIAAKERVWLSATVVSIEKVGGRMAPSTAPHTNYIVRAERTELSS